MFLRHSDAGWRRGGPRGWSGAAAAHWDGFPREPSHQSSETKPVNLFMNELPHTFLWCGWTTPPSMHWAWFSLHVCLWFSMSVTQAMEWLIEHVDDPSVDAPLPGQESSGATGAATVAASGAATGAAAATPGLSASASSPCCNLLRSQSSSDESSRQDELTEIFKRIRRKREFRPDSRVRGVLLSNNWSFLPGSLFLLVVHSAWIYYPIHAAVFSLRLSLLWWKWASVRRRWLMLWGSITTSRMLQYVHTHMHNTGVCTAPAPPPSLLLMHKSDRLSRKVK